MEKLFEALTIQEEETRVVAMQTLVEIGRQEYESVQYYFEKICQVTAYIAKNDDEKVGAQAIEFWTSLAEEELRRVKIRGYVVGYIKQCHTDLLLLLIDCIQKVNVEAEDEDDAEWGVALSAGCCLSSVA